MKCDSLPRASKVKAARSELNKTVKLFSIPTFDGSYRHVETAIREEITRLLGECPTLFQLGEKIPVKFSGDGAKFSRTSNMMILSFSILVPQGRYLSGTGNHTIAVVKGCEDLAVVKGCEDYETISKAFGI
ncbi:hypothetical protein EMCRGX_G020878 [Ephydatia muelleri]